MRLSFTLSAARSTASIRIRYSHITLEHIHLNTYMFRYALRIQHAKCPMQWVYN